MRICIVTAEYPPNPGGVADYSEHLGKALRAAGQSVLVISSGELEDLGWDWSIRHAMAVAALIADSSPDLILLQYVPQMYGTGGIAPGVTLLARRLVHLLPGRLVITLHEMASRWTPTLGGLARAAAHRLQLAALISCRTPLIVTNPEYGSRLRDRVSAERVHEIPAGSGVPVLANSEDERRLLRGSLGGGPLVGQFSPLGIAKRPEDLVDVLAQLKPPTRLVLIGGRPQDEVRRQNLRAAFRRAGLGERVHETAYLSREQVSRYLAALDVYVDTASAGASTRNTSLAAALAHGLPVAAYDGIETPEVFSGSHAFRLVRVGDTSALATAVSTLLADPNARHHLGNCARALSSSHLAWKVLARRHLEIVQ
jgi:glycosyltransferase involved in cell wall biosynthesis